MFSGIVEEIGEVKKVIYREGRLRLEIGAKQVLQDVKVGDSIAVNGTCLTIVGTTPSVVSFDVVNETSKNTNLGSFKISDKVNLERSLKIGDRISGHFVSGHIDCLGIIRSRRIVSGNLSLEIAVPSKFAGCLLPKGSVAVDGISLTMASRKSNIFIVNIIPHTLKNTTIHSKGPSSKVNIEFDMLVKSAHIM